ncbi:hypothetical protein QR680_004646 [Steinernema hermaphroditum]|uniref:SLC12A transporter C-terminal domain-containing protein n=1 Tax=Steinernema hermaphroditum TaxID=289476 RepID=A0AA39HRM9_9BILA|nr:hypothetical protein QR680_004646 [Steinernema hermaphroditum]
MDKKCTKLPIEEVPFVAPAKPKPESDFQRFLRSCYDRAEATQITDDSAFISTPTLQSFWGVFVPRMQNALCLSFLLLRLPWMVGVLGLVQSMLVILAAALLIMPTTFSVVALCTSGHEHLSGGPFSILSYSVGDCLALSIAVLFALANIILSAVHVNLAVEIFFNSIAVPYSLLIGRDYLLYLCGVLFIVFVLVFLNKRIFQFIAFVPSICITAAILFVYIGIVHNLRTGELQVHGCVTGRLLHPRGIVEPRIQNGSCTCVRVSEGGSSRNISAPECYTDAQFKTAMHFLTLVFTALAGHVFGANISPKVSNPRKRVVHATVAAKFFTIAVLFVNTVIFGMFVDSFLLVDRFGITRDSQGTAASVALVNPHVINGLMILSSIIAAAQCARAQKAIVREVLKCRLFDGTGLMHAIRTHREKTTKRVPMSAALIKEYIRLRNTVLGLIEGLVLIGFSLCADVDLLVVIASHLFLQAAAVINIVSGLLTSFRSNSWHPHFRGFNSCVSLVVGLLCWITSAWLLPSIAILISLPFVMLTVFVFVKRDPVTSLSFVDAMMHCADMMLSASIGQVSKQGKGRFRPRIVIFVHTPGIPDALIRVGKALEQDSGCPSLVMTLIREPPYTPGDKRMKLGKLEVACAMMGMSVNDLPGHAMILYYQKISSLQSVIMAANNNAGMGMFKLDTVIMNYPTKTTIAAAAAIRFHYQYSMHRAARRRANLIVVKGSFLIRKLETIDVWWILDAGDLLVNLAKQLSKYEKMNESSNKKAKIRLYLVVPDHQTLPSTVEKKLVEYMYSTRTLFHSLEVVKVQICLIWMYMSKLKERLEFRVSQAIGSSNKGERFLKRQLRKKYPIQSSVDLSVREHLNDESLFSRASLEASVTTEQKSKYMKTMNREILRRSKEADLVILNMPQPPTDLAPFEEYLHFVDEQIQGLDNVLLVHSCDTL